MDPIYHCRQRIQMRFKDIDMFGHVNNNVYLEYLDYGKTQYIQQVLGDMFNTLNDALVLVNINCNFLVPTRYNEPVEVLTAVLSIGERSLRMSQRIINPDTQEVKCEATVVMVGFNAHTQTSFVIPDNWRKLIADFEGWDKNNQKS